MFCGFSRNHFTVLPHHHSQPQPSYLSLFNTTPFDFPHSSAGRSKLTFRLPSSKMVSLILLLTTVLATYASAKPILVGFRTVCEAEKKVIDEKGWVIWDEEHESANWNGQLGIGKSHSNRHGLWQGRDAGNIGGDYWCYTTAEDSKIRKINKVWINALEQPAQGQTFYPYNEDKIQEMLSDVGVRKPKLALRLGRCGNGEEVLIPAAALPGPDDEDGGLLKLRTYCFNTEEEMRRHMRRRGLPETADYDSATFTSERYKSVSQVTEQATIDEGEGEAAAGPARLLRFMPRDSGKTTAKGSGKQGTTASHSASSSSDTLQLAKGYTITLKKDPNSKKFPNPKVDECPATSGKKPKVSASSKNPNTGGKKKSNPGGK